MTPHDPSKDVQSDQHLATRAHPSHDGWAADLFRPAPPAPQHARRGLPVALAIGAAVALAAAAMFALARPAGAQPAGCAPRDALAARLSATHGEAPQARGLAGDGVLEWWANPETETWTLTLTRPDGLMCLLGAGHAFVATPSPAAVIEEEG